MSTWSEFAAEAPALAAAIRELLHQYGRGMAYLATVRKDGGPRLHPVSPIVTDEGLYCFVIASPKRDDLNRDGRFALHSFPGETTDAEAVISGRARQVMNVSIVDQMARTHRAAPGVDWTLFEFTVETALLHRQSPGAAPSVWRATPRDRAAPARLPILVAA
jgi:hypothetical protein